MKHLIFLSARIRQYYQSSRAIFCIFIVGSVLLNVLILYMYGNTVTYMRSKKLNTPLYCKYTVNLSEAGFAELSAELEECLTGYQIKDFTFHSGWETEDGFIPLAASQNNDAGLEWQKVKGRIAFTDSEVKSMARCIIVPYDRSSLKPGDTLPIGELGEFSVIGAGTFYSANYIPSTLFEALKLPVYYVDILLAKRLPVEEHQPFMDKLSAISGASQVIPAYGVSDDIAYLPRNLAEIFILHVFTIAAFFFLLQYISVLNRKMDAVSELTGASKGTVAFYLLLERLVLSLITALCAAVIHRIFYSSIFERFNLASIDYELRDYCIVTVIMVLSSVVASVPFTISYARRSALKEYRQ